MSNVSRSPTPDFKGPAVTDGNLSVAGTATTPLPSALEAQEGAPPASGRTKRARTISNSMSVPDFLRPNSIWGARFSKWAGKHLNFFRIHVCYFVFTPLIFSGIFYAANGDVHIRYIDCLFVCVSAMTVTGLSTINISTCTDFQQALLFILMCIGNLTAVSATMVWTRRHFFRRKFEDVVARSAKARRKMRDVEEAERREGGRLGRLRRMMFGGASPDQSVPSSMDSSEEAQAAAATAQRKKSQKRKGTLTADMIRRTDQPAMLVNPMGMPSTAHPARNGDDNNNDEAAAAAAAAATTDAAGLPARGILAPAEDAPFSAPAASSNNNNNGSIRISEPMRFVRGAMLTESPSEIMEQGPLSAPGPQRRSLLASGSEASVRDREALYGVFQPPLSADAMRTRFDDSANPRRRRLSDPHAGPHSRRGSDGGSIGRSAIRPPAPDFPRSQTVEFAAADPPSRATSGALYGAASAGGLRHRTSGLEFERTPTSYTTRSYTRRSAAGIPLTRTVTTSKERGFGGFPSPFELAGSALKRLAPEVQRRINRTTTMPRTSTIASAHSGPGAQDGVRSAPYLSFDLTVSRNSRFHFHELSEAQRDELGGVEYRAIDMLSKLIPAYWLLMNFFFIVLVAPWLAKRSASIRYHEVADSQAPHTPNSTWFWFFQVVSAYTNTGLSLIDTSMVQLADQYFMLIPIGTLILAGNTAFPILLRFFIWLCSQVVPRNGRSYETLRFLLDHPRRCFVYLFPSAQTWFLLFVLVLLNCTDWVAFLVLDLGNPVIKSIPLGQRVFDGLFQSIAVRAAGFQVVSLLTLAPAVQYLYVVMMYISVFPVAMSVRNTNVYEERALGIYEEEPAEDDTPATAGARIWGNYLTAHVRRQLAFDMWWLGFSLWLLCIIEKNNIEDPTTNNWFTIFSCLFELTSAYGTVGLSTGTPFDNFSLSGRFSTLSKLVVCAVMLRGRHRGLPVAIDRAVLLPGDSDAEDASGIDTRTDISDELSRNGGFGTSSMRYGGGGPTMSYSRTFTGNALDEKTPVSAAPTDTTSQYAAYGEGHPTPALEPITEATPTPTGMSRNGSQRREYPTEDTTGAYFAKSDDSASSSEKGKAVDTSAGRVVSLDRGAVAESNPSNSSAASHSQTSRNEVGETAEHQQSS